MIDDALSYVKNILDQQLRNQFDISGNMVVLNNLVDSSGGLPLKNQNKLVLTLINLEHETSKPFYGTRTAPDAKNNIFRQMMPTVRFNLDVLLTASFDDYSESLRFLSAVIAFFQANPIIKRQNFPDIPDGIEQLQFEIENSPYENTHNLWSALGARYQPSIIYKIRHIAIQANQINGEAPVLRQVSSQAQAGR